MDTLLSLKVFCEIVDAGSFVAAAQRLSLSAPMVSKHLAHLEAKLGVRLLNRTSRRLSLTEAGNLYFQQSREALDILELAAVTIGSSVEAPRGTLKITAPVWFGSVRTVKLLAAYQEQYPDVVLDLHFSNRKVELAAEGYDLALRVARELSPHQIVRRICKIQFYLVAAPSYLKAKGRLDTVADLEDCRGIVPNYLDSEGFEFEGPKGRVQIHLDPIMRSDDSSYSYHAVCAGLGIGLLPGWLVNEDLQAGRLLQVLPKYKHASYELYATYISRKYLTPKVRTFIDFLTEALGD